MGSVMGAGVRVPGGDSLGFHNRTVKRGSLTGEVAAMQSSSTNSVMTFPEVSELNQSSLVTVVGALQYHFVLMASM